MTGDSYEPGRINRLYRNPRRGMIFGVCAGLAEHFGFDVTVTRVLVVIAGFFSGFMICVVYLLLGLLLPIRPQEGEREQGPTTRCRRSGIDFAISIHASRAWRNT
jgi:phage shock protein PspC (stress-responsive transcriptional regulator)